MIQAGRLHVFRLALALSIAAAALGLTLVAQAQGGSSFRTDLVSRANGTHGGGGNSDSYLSGEKSVSGNGRLVVFQSDADNLSSADNNSYTNVFVRDLSTKRTILVSRRSGAHGGAGNDGSYTPSISANGRFVAFESDGDNMSSADDNNYTNIFVRDLVEKRTILVSRRNGLHGAGAGDYNYSPSISANGRFVAFQSGADNLSSADDNNQDNIFVRDLAGHRTILASRRTGVHGTGGDDDSFDVSMSANGRFVAFSSYADNLSSADDNCCQDIFVRDLSNKRTILASRRSDGGSANAYSYSPSISGSGRFVAFETDATNLVGGDVNGVKDIIVRDLFQHRNILASRRNGVHGGHTYIGSRTASISDSGRFVAFVSDDDTLSSADNDSFGNIFVRGLANHRTILASRRNGRHGGGADETSSDPSISASGRFVAFDTQADNLSSADDNSYQNVFRRDVLGP